jgi:hypothetical protein
MTRPTPPPGIIVEIDAMDVAEWEHGQRTPQASDANIAALLEKTAPPAPRAEDGAPRTATVARPRVTPRGLPRAKDAPVTIPAIGDVEHRGAGMALPVGPSPGGRTSPAGSTDPGLPRPASGASPVPALPPLPRQSVPRASTATPVALPPIALPPIAPARAVTPAAAFAAFADASTPFETVTRPEISTARWARSSETGDADAARAPCASAPVPAASPSFGVPDPGDIVPVERASAPSVPTRARAPSPGFAARAERPTMPSMPSHAPRAPSPPGEPARIRPGPAASGAASAPRGEPPGAAAPGRPMSTSRVHRAAPPVNAREAPVGSGPQAVPLPLPAPVESARIVGPRPGERASSPASQGSGRDDSQERTATSEPEARAGSAPGSAPGRRWWLWLGGGSVCAAGAIALALMLWNRAGSDPLSVAPPADDRVATSPAAAHGVTALEGAPREGRRRDAAPGDAIASEIVATSAPARVTPPEPAASTEAPSPAASPPAHDITRSGSAVIRPTRRPGKRAAIKPIVEYNDRGLSGSEVPGIIALGSEDPAITQARAAYVSGNQRLFVGDIEGAITAYRKALAVYPGYVGGYRGLGLAYAQRGDTDKALDAFQTYVTTAPSAKDVALIKKRIARLQGK